MAPVMGIDPLAIRYVYPCLHPSERNVIDLLLALAGSGFPDVPYTVLNAAYAAGGASASAGRPLAGRRTYGYDRGTCIDGEGDPYTCIEMDVGSWLVAVADYAASPWSTCMCPKLSWPAPPWRDPCKDP